MCAVYEVGNDHSLFFIVSRFQVLESKDWYNVNGLTVLGKFNCTNCITAKGDQF